MTTRVPWKTIALSLLTAGGVGYGGSRLAAAPPAPPAEACQSAESLRPVLEAIRGVRGDVATLREDLRAVRAEAVTDRASLRAEIQAQAARIDRVLEKVGK